MKQNDRTNNGLFSISQTVLPFAKKVLGKKGFVEIDILTNWDKIVGEDLAEYSQPQRIDFKKDERNNGVLYLNVLSGAHSLEIKHKEKLIIEKVNTYFGYMAVSAIKIVQNNQDLRQEYVEVKEDKKLVSIEEENYITELTADVSDEKLKETLSRLGKSIIINNKGKK